MSGLRTWVTALAAGGGAVGAALALVAAPGAQVTDASSTAPVAGVTTGETAALNAAVRQASELRVVVAGLETRMRSEEQQVAARARSNSAEQAQLSSEKASLDSQAAQLQAADGQFAAEEQQVAAERQQLASAEASASAPTYHATTGASGATGRSSGDGGDD